MMLGLCWLICTGATESSQRFAVVVGANDGGAAQAKLRYAQEDASRFAAVLNDLSGIPSNHIQLLLQPSVQELRQVLDQLEFAVDPDQRVNSESMFVFYYSGHAKATALNLGNEELSLDEIRRRLDRLPAKVRLVILDACQSGAFVNVKGATTAQDFSFNSVERLAVTGAAVLASSSASELSQEAEEVEGSYFTQHVIAALRGAADADDDARVTLDEVYRYTYPRTLEDTARTRVGSQHVTFETTLSGQGGLPLSYVHQRQQRVLLPAALSGRAVFFRASTNALMADVRKAKGEVFAVSLPEGTYRVTVRTASIAYQCEVTSEARLETVLDTRTCIEVPDASTTSKHATVQLPRLALELGVGLATVENDAFDARLRLFSYKPDSKGPLRFHVQGSCLWSLWSFLAVFVEGAQLEEATYERRVSSIGSSSVQRYWWSSFAVGAGLRASFAVLSDQLFVFTSVGAGPSLSLAKSSASGGTGVFRSTDVTWFIHPAVGLSFLVDPRVGLFVRCDWFYAPSLRNLMRETHNSGGLAFHGGIRVGIW